MKTIIFTLLILINSIIYCQNIPKLDDTGYMNDTTKVLYVSNTDRYMNQFTQNSFIKIKLKSFLSDDTIVVVMLNTDFAVYFAREKGFINSKGKFYNEDSGYKYFDKYSKYMIENDGRSITINMDMFNKFMAKSKYPEYIVAKETRLSDLDVKERKELLTKYFYQEMPNGAYLLKAQYREHYNNSASFKALLLDLGYDLRSYDCLPTDWYLACEPMPKI